MKIMPVAEYTENQLTESQLTRILALVNSVWPNPEKTVAELVEEEILFAKNLNYELIWRSVVWERGKAIAHAKIFPRIIYSGTQKISVMALASVCVSPMKRGMGYGQAVVESTFRYIDRSDFEVTLFQTGVPKFYEKLGARIIHNRFVNSKHKTNPDKNPWWEEFIMIYPSTVEFPDGIIDLNGPGY